MSGRGKGHPYPGGNSRQSGSKKDAKRKRSGQNSSGLTPEMKKGPLENQVNPGSSPAAPCAASIGESRTSEFKIPKKVDSTPAVEKTQDGGASQTRQDRSFLGALSKEDFEKMMDEEEVDDLLKEDEDEVPMDLDDKELEEIGKEQLEIKGDSGDSKSADDKGSSAPSYRDKVAGVNSARGFEVLYVHFGDKERTPIAEETFYRLWDRIQQKGCERMLKGEDVPDNVLWKKWSQGRGLVSVGDKETSDFIIKLVEETKVNRRSFRAWRRGEFGEGRLVTGFLKGSGFKDRTGEELMTLLMKQNKLEGKHTGVVMKDESDGRLLRFFANPTLWKDLMSRRQNEKNRRVRLKLVFGPTTFVLSRDKGTPEQKKPEKPSDSQPSPPVVPCTTSNDNADNTDDGGASDAQDPDKPLEQNEVRQSDSLAD